VFSPLVLLFVSPDIFWPLSIFWLAVLLIVVPFMIFRYFR
jgi:hypothetical protein